MGNSISFKYYILLLGAFLVYSATGVFSKLTSQYDFLSLGYLSYFGLVFFVMGIYALLWQVILKKVPLTQAYLFKSSTVVFSLFSAYILFGESISLQNIVGALLIIIGIIINSTNKSIS